MSYDTEVDPASSEYEWYRRKWDAEHRYCKWNYECSRVEREIEGNIKWTGLVFLNVLGSVILFTSTLFDTTSSSSTYTGPNVLFYRFFAFIFYAVAFSIYLLKKWRESYLSIYYLNPVNRYKYVFGPSSFRISKSVFMRIKDLDGTKVFCGLGNFYIILTIVLHMLNV